ncbi:hypothetical protein [Microbispora sp. H10885]|uniref:hypothetical protein n=1 Tax=Microbispora sp. H10885 TaxID=2729110 RepID=UPI0037C5B19B
MYVTEQEPGGTGVPLGDGDGLGEGLREGDTLGEGEALGDGDALGEGETLGDGLGDVTVPAGTTIVLIEFAGNVPVKPPAPTCTSASLLMAEVSAAPYR